MITFSKNEEGFQVFGRMSNGTESPAINVAKDDLLIDLKESFEAWSNIAPSQQSLIFDGKLLDDDARSLESYMIRPLSTVQLQVRPRGVNSMDHHDGITTHNYNRTPQKTSEVTPPWSQSYKSFMFSHVSTVQLQVSPPDIDTTDQHETHDFPDWLDLKPTHQYNPTLVQVPNVVTPLQRGLSNQGNSDRHCTIDDRAQSLNTSMLGHLSPGGLTFDLTNEYADNTAHLLSQCEPSDQDSQSLLSKFLQWIFSFDSRENPFRLDTDSYEMNWNQQGFEGTFLNNTDSPFIHR